MEYLWLRAKRAYWVAVSYVLDGVFRAKDWLKWMP